MTMSNDKSKDTPTLRYFRQSQLIPHILPFSSATLWRKVKDGTFPSPVKLSDRVTAWSAEAVEAWLQARQNGLSLRCNEWR